MRGQNEAFTSPEELREVHTESLSQLIHLGIAIAAMVIAVAAAKAHAESPYTIRRVIFKPRNCAEQSSKAVGALKHVWELCRDRPPA